jgi:HNH endonuclease
VEHAPPARAAADAEVQLPLPDPRGCLVGGAGPRGWYWLRQAVATGRIPVRLNGREWCVRLVDVERWRDGELRRRRGESLTRTARPRTRPAGWAKLRFAVLKRDGYRCQACGREARDGAVLQVDHRRAVAAGGTDDAANLWVLCRDCNLGKGTDPL